MALVSSLTKEAFTHLATAAPGLINTPRVLDQRQNFMQSKMFKDKDLYLQHAIAVYLRLAKEIKCLFFPYLWNIVSVISLFIEISHPSWLRS